VDPLARRVVARFSRRFASDHVEKLVKVNAPVDEGIAEVVEALNAFPKLYTTDSCQGRDDGWAFVWFRYGDTAQETVDFLFWLETRGLAGLEGCHMSAMWGGGRTLRLELKIAHAAISWVAERLNQVAGAYPSQAGG
jgi:hypothetical protein